MYIYEVGYGTCEESNFWQIMHEEKFTKKQFDQIVEDCIFEALLKEVKPTSKYKHCRAPSFSDVMESSSSRKKRGSTDRTYYHWFMRALNKRGFSKVEFEHLFHVFGWASSVHPKSWTEYTDKEHQGLARRMYKRLLKARPNYNAEVKKGKEKEKKEKEAFRKRHDAKQKKLEAKKK